MAPSISAAITAWMASTAIDNVAANNFDPGHDGWANGWGSGFRYHFDDLPAKAAPTVSFLRPALDASEHGTKYICWAELCFLGTSLFKNMKTTGRVNLQFVRKHSALTQTHGLPVAGGRSNELPHQFGSFGQAGGTFNHATFSLG
jgi:hypothetical protein